MSSFFDLPPLPQVPVAGSDNTFPVRRVFCVGRNYAAHAAEMGVEVDREAPFYFTKTPWAICHTGSTIPYPLETENYHYEMEFVVAIGKPAFRVSIDNAMDAVFGYACGLDMTRRDLQLAARAKQRPWDLGKDVEDSAVIAPISPAADFAIADQRIALSVNGEVKQDAHLTDLIWSVPEIIAHLSRFYHLQPGDLIYTGTPAGVGPVVAGDVIEGTIDGLAPVTLTLGAAE
ncbi:fumarylacetoacetate hydrolase family protein [Lutimaribacter saemankumensis]|uniref:Fumarylpyruvate hydrolase n=1 Tax=Lutimaribacter saemankumensis TaxID=490829 RepID=A0A1G8JLZ3_9RHOB|nr:fumarylacetoacetate hydrolase family protein [Lutimaribacter saemankumensis]SDI32329.1 fumarylpyruvate hydrolase [Lutimaribacter saemankumensis]